MVLLFGSIHSPAEKKIEVLQCFSDHNAAMLNKCWCLPALRELHRKFEFVFGTISPAFVANNPRHAMLDYGFASASDLWVLDSKTACFADDRKLGPTALQPRPVDWTLSEVLD
uniref:Uncharacterized protein n=1 Tax=Trichuris muris TaxID=70415 RepID=A0A5S6QCR1_TRIMR